MSASDYDSPASEKPDGWLAIFGVFLRLGLTSFGGPTAHIAYFREAFVERRKWLSDAEYADLVALCQFLPGPASSQVGFAVGLRRGGWLGGAAAWLGFTLPSALLLIAFGLTLSRWSDPGEAGWLHGLQLAAVAVIANAVWSMAKSLCPDRLRATLALASAALVLAWPGTPAQLAVILVGGLVGWLLLPKAAVPAPQEVTSGMGATRVPGGWLVTVGCLVLLAILLAGLPVVAGLSGSPLWAAIDGHFRTGALVFGGGHVVLPMLRAEMVDPGLVSEASFLAGYGAAQAVPGPLFTFSAFLGSVMDSGEAGVSPAVMGLLCLVAIFAPTWLLIGGLLPLWEKLRRFRALRRALAGTNAAVVGLLGAALYQPAWTGAVTSVGAVIFLLGVSALLMVWRWPPWLVVIVAGLAGAMAL